MSIGAFVVMLIFAGDAKTPDSLEDYGVFCPMPRKGKESGFNSYQPPRKMTQ
jgi:hypothetical protein